jgi:hypothetical protein
MAGGIRMEFPRRRDLRSFYIGDPDPSLIDGAARLVELMAQPVPRAGSDA